MLFRVRPPGARALAILLCLRLSLGGRPVATSYVDFADELRSLPCAEPRDFGSLLRGHLVHYPDNAAYDSFSGDDLVHGRHPDMLADSDGRPHSVLCGGAASGGGMWHVQKIGPFRSTGGGDWWQFAWNDMFGLDGSLGEPSLLQQGAIAMTAHFTGPVSTDGEPIGLPPLHVHHIHLTPNSGLSWASDILECMLTGEICPGLDVIYAHHGDRQLLVPDGPAARQSFATFGEEYGGYGKRLHAPISCTGEINDLRPAGAAPIVWWYQSAVRLLTGAQATRPPPLSLHYLYNPFDIGLDSQQASKVKQSSC